ncbi:MAG TPA: 16S rRNA (guanine(527)-N(7))-methyltransferase RsmG [Nitrospiria bacterium]|nr:16S rRNA (guanine(527)-N(7))-methyltransferase RsmG [Candidatus Manganitrophaceae bacterium]HIL35717.1 16S rRNA (guanine(527)-N(7))-methyltransferase RsmG [Candidatus Manganitrophaceae bacterium]
MLVAGCKTLGLFLSSSQVDQFMAYLSELIRWNGKINLTGFQTEDEIVIKFFLDALTPLGKKESACGIRWIDVGTGAGSPGLPLKIVRPDLQMTLVEPIEKKVTFLHHIIGLLGLSEISVAHDRIESLRGKEWDWSYDLLLTRGLDPRLVLREGASLVRKGGHLLFYQAAGEDKKWRDLLRGYPDMVLEELRPVRLPFSTDPRTLILINRRFA